MKVWLFRNSNVWDVTMNLEMVKTILHSIKRDMIKFWKINFAFFDKEKTVFSSLSFFLSNPFSINRNENYYQLTNLLIIILIQRAFQKRPVIFTFVVASTPGTRQKKTTSDL